MQTSKFTDQIREQTASSHQALEKLVVQFIKHITVASDYRKLLLVFYGYYKPLENITTPYINRFSNWEAIRKAELLLSDIHELNSDGTMPTMCNELPVIKNDADALAVHYVLEGSTLGGKYILQMVRKKIELPIGYADRFFTGHGSDTEVKWSMFKDILDENLSEEQLPAFLNKVTETFNLLKNWAAVNFAYDEQEKL